MATSDQIQERIEAFARELREELGEVDQSKGVCWLDALENEAIEISDALQAELVKNRSVDTSLPEEATCPECGKLGRYQGDRQRELVGRRGPVSIAEPKYYCPCCRKAFFPDDARDRR